MSVYVFVSAVLAPVIYLDAVSHNIGRVPSSSGQILNFSAGLWALLVLMFWPIFGALYLVHRDGLLDRARKQPVVDSAWRGKAAAWIALSGVLVVGSWYRPGQTQPAAGPSPVLSTPETVEPTVLRSLSTIDWNTRNPDALKNGNISRAAALFKASNPDYAELVPEAEPVLKAPWQYYGQWLCLAGTADSVTDFPPGSDQAKALQTDSPAEVVFETGDGVIADFLLINGSGQLKSGEEVTVCGYPVGRTEVPAPTGGVNTHLVLVGDWHK